MEQKSSYELDYAVLVFGGNPAAVWGKLALSGSDPALASAIYVIQHPAGEAKKISKKHCAVGAVPVDGRGSGTDFAHTCDTAGGSSGSPVFNDAGEVVGLHHYGFAEGSEWSENRAIRMKRILDDLNKQASSGHWRASIVRWPGRIRALRFCQERAHHARRQCAQRITKPLDFPQHVALLSTMTSAGGSSSCRSPTMSR